MQEATVLGRRGSSAVSGHRARYVDAGHSQAGSRSLTWDILEEVRTWSVMCFIGETHVIHFLCFPKIVGRGWGP